jgi:hypothetical protein
MEGGNRLHNELKGGERATNTLNFLWRLHLDGQSMLCIAQIRSGFVAREKPWQVGRVRKGGDTEATRRRHGVGERPEPESSGAAMTTTSV